MTLLSDSPSISDAIEEPGKVLDSVREELASLLSKPIQVDQISAIKSGYERRLGILRIQLKEQQQARYKSLSEVTSILESSKSEVEFVKEKILKIVELCSGCTKSVDEDVFDHAVRLSNARTNMCSVVQQLELYDAVPQRSAQLIENVEKVVVYESESFRSLRQVCIEWLELDMWRSYLVSKVYDSMATAKEAEFSSDDLASSWRVFHQIEEESHENEDIIAKPRDLGVDAHERILDRIKTHFGQVERLGTLLLNEVHKILKSFMSLVQNEEPEKLVAALEFVERMDLAQDRERERRIRAGQSPEKAELILPKYQRRKQALTILENVMTERLQASFPKTFLEDETMDCNESEKESVKNEHRQPRISESKISAFVSSASACIVDLEVVTVDVNKCFPPSYNIVGLYRWVLESRVLALLEPLSAKGATPARSRLELIGWIDQYVNTVRSCCSISDPGGNDASEKSIGHDEIVDDEQRVLAEAWTLSASKRLNKLTEFLDTLMSEYIEESSTRLQTHMTSVLERFVENTDKELLNIPQDLFHLVGQEITLVHQYGICGSVLVKFVKGGIFVALKWLQRNLSTKISDTNNAIAVESCACILRDCERMYDLCDEVLFVEVRNGINPDESITSLTSIDLKEAKALVNEMRESVDDIAAGFVKLIGVGIDVIVTTIFKDFVAGGTQSSFFTEKWVSGEAKSMQSVCATFLDYFDDPEEGLVHYFASDLLLGKLVATCFVRLLNSYVIKFMSLNVPFKDCRAAASRVNSDCKVLEECFSRYTKILSYSKALIRGGLMTELMVMSHIAGVLGDMHPQNHFEELASDFGHFADQAIARTIFLRGDLQSEVCSFLLEYDISEYVNAPRDSARFDLSAIPRVEFTSGTTSGKGKLGDYQSMKSNIRKSLRKLKISKKARRPEN